MIIIGEKINGSIPSVAKAISEKNKDFIRNLARAQSDAGADYILESRVVWFYAPLIAIGEKMIAEIQK